MTTLKVFFIVAAIACGLSGIWFFVEAINNNHAEHLGVSLISLPLLWFCVGVVNACDEIDKRLPAIKNEGGKENLSNL